MKVEERKENRELFALSESMADRGSLREEREPGAVEQIEENPFEQDEQFLYILKNKRSIFLDHLQDLGLLSSFLEVENGTNLKP